MTIFSHAHAIAASRPKTRCAACLHHEAMIRDLQACIDDLRQSRDRWRDLALETVELEKFAASDSSRRAA
jgi:ribosomal protein S14